MDKKQITTIILVLIFCLSAWLILFDSPESKANQEQFTVETKYTTDEITKTLKSQGFIKSSLGYKISSFLMGKKEIKPGAYKLSKDMNTFQVASKLINTEPYMKWVSIPEGLRKEQIAEELSEKLDWSKEQIENWNNVYTEQRSGYKEGVYFPDTYLIPVDESPEKTVERFISKFEENFKEYSKQAANENIKWTTLINIASLIQREANGKEDMSLISGIIWNRLLNDMKLDIDATIQYIKGSEDNWWPNVEPEDRSIDSHFNTYIYKGVPPHPIASPGINAIEAALNPENTNCFYYIHDDEGSIYCSENYQEHKEKIDKYL